MIDKIKNTDLLFTAPPSKAHTLRALILSSLARGTSTITNPLLGEDQQNLISCLKNLGIDIVMEGNKIILKGCAGKFSPVNNTLNCGESGVSMNVLSALACLVDEDIILTGAEGLLKRPIGEVINGLKQLGGHIEYMEKENFPPVLIKKGTLQGGTSEISGAKTSQYFSAITLAAPCCKETSTLVCTDNMSEKPYFDITREMMSLFGVEISNEDYAKITIQPQDYTSADIIIEGDYSSASFFMLAAAITQSSITIKGLNRNSVQGDRKIVDYLEQMGCHCRWDQQDFHLTGSELNPIEQNMNDTPDLVPPMAIAAAFARGTSIFSGVGHLQFKECNRLEAIINELKKMGVHAHYADDKLIIEGNKEGIKGSTIETYNDHRIAMSFAVAGLVTGNQEILDPKCVAKSFPDFWERFRVFYQ